MGVSSCLVQASAVRTLLGVPVAGALARGEVLARLGRICQPLAGPGCWCTGWGGQNTKCLFQKQ